LNKSLTRACTWLVAAGIGLAAPGARAQQPAAPPVTVDTAGDAPSDAMPAPADAPAPVTPKEKPIEFFGAEDVNLTPEEMLDQATALMQEMRESLTRALEILTKARESKDVIRLNCVNEKLTPMKGILKIAEDALIGLQENIATGNLEAARYEYSKIKIAHEKVSTLLVQAINCVGAEATYAGDTEVDVEIDEELAGGDPYYGDPQILVDPADIAVDGDPDDTEVGEDPELVERLPPSSPFR